MTASGEPPLAAVMADDAALVARLAARDAAGLREVIGRHAASLNRIAYRMVGDAHEAEDIVQEACLRLWDHAPRLAARHPAGTPAGGTLRLSGWLARVVTNLAIDRLRAGRRISGEEVPERADEAPLADAVIAENQEAEATRALVMALPDRQRAAIVLTYYEELPNAEAAAALDMNIKAFESLLLRARAALRKAFAAQGDAR
ncbi:MAG: sigma-70 family RNA polymerase sigma factor [Erythrobacter sp.]|uniref:sigma-70 family RNA polymerase sigma factor n=1 Tax=Erythrobacter sp. TaxID=1042 RepID=UPI002B4A26B3|nr:sigma-70 family RNA polymerase sigma factor [Erythrobacter sp.]WRH71657.1 MAG: sigma-70 family RNA polymerase sigma factor [Erythrobacter sp.]